MDADELLKIDCVDVEEVFVVGVDGVCRRLLVAGVIGPLNA